ncbi:hypothetical protein ACJIZ3_014384 [Penstemon smallii]|uniref:Uncharacterized protein n=1 Tax=Penstemon smallii TaxID=265156 RepID=A0ABD3RR09_9LAMI
MKKYEILGQREVELYGNLDIVDNNLPFLFDYVYIPSAIYKNLNIIAEII